MDRLKPKFDELKNLYEYSWKDGERTLKIQLYAISPKDAQEIIESLAAHINDADDRA